MTDGPIPVKRKPRMTKAEKLKIQQEQEAAALKAANKAAKHKANSGPSSGATSEVVPDVPFTGVNWEHEYARLHSEYVANRRLFARARSDLKDADELIQHYRKI